eukprot:scaffold334_cov241-Pinguiococcus_pyrenoidosus.AAC.47
MAFGSGRTVEQRVDCKIRKSHVATKMPQMRRQSGIFLRYGLPFMLFCAGGMYLLTGFVAGQKEHADRMVRGLNFGAGTVRRAES